MSKAKAKPKSSAVASSTEYRMYVEFSREKESQNFSSFRAASSLESLKQVHRPSDSDNAENVKDTNTDPPASPIDQLCSKYIDRFEAELSRYHHLISIVNLIGGSLAVGAIDGHVLPEAVKHGTKIHSDKLTEIYGFSENGFEVVIRQFRRTNEITAGLHVLPSSTLLSLVANFDSLIGDFVKEILTAKPEKVKFSDRTITYRELFQNGDVSKILEDAINSEVDKLLRGSHKDQIIYIEELIDTKILGHYNRIPNYLEIFERRNQFAHAAGLITQYYIDQCKSFKYPVEELVVGNNFDLCPNYLHRAVDYLTEFGILFAFMTWRKHGDGNSNPFSKLNSVCYELIVKRRYKIASYLLDFALHKQGCKTDDITKRMMQVNLANSYARMGKTEKAKQTLNELDWSACSDKFKISVAAVRGDVDAVCKILPKAVASNAISKLDLRRWPVFDNVNDTKEFAKAFEDVFREPFQVELMPNSAVESDQSSDIDKVDLNPPKSVH